MDTSMKGTAPPGMSVSMRNVPSFATSTRPKPCARASPFAAAGALPVGASCHVSIIASPTAAPAPSIMRPVRTMRRPDSAKVTLPPPFQRKPSWKNGPIVWEGVRASMSDPHRRRLRAREHDVEAVSGRDLLDAGLEVQLAHHARARGLVGYAVEDRIDREQRIAREVHLRDEP